MILRRTLLLLFIGVSIQLSAQNIKFESIEHDFGNIDPKGRDVRHDFRFTNDGDAPLVIINVVTNCNCTKATYPKRPVMPGEEGVITISYDPKNQMGVLNKRVTILSNSDGEQNSLTVKGLITDERQ